jgi:hypothetical protein
VTPGIRRPGRLLREPLVSLLLVRHAAIIRMHSRLHASCRRSSALGDPNCRCHLAQLLELLEIQTAVLPQVHDAVEVQLRTWATERWHEERSTYRYAELPRGGMGPESNYTGGCC